MQIDQVARSMLVRRHVADHAPAGIYDPDCRACSPWPLTDADAPMFTATVSTTKPEPPWFDNGPGYARQEVDGG